MAELVRDFLAQHQLDRYVDIIVGKLAYDHMPTFLSLTPEEVDAWAEWMPEGHRKRLKLAILAQNHESLRIHVPPAATTQPQTLPQPQPQLQPQLQPLQWVAAARPPRPPAVPAAAAPVTTWAAAAAQGAQQTRNATYTTSPSTTAPSRSPSSSSSSSSSEFLAQPTPAPRAARIPSTGRFHLELDKLFNEPDDDDSPLHLVRGDVLPQDLKAWDLQGRYYGFVNFFTRRVLPSSDLRLNGDSEQRSWILFPVGVHVSEDETSLVAVVTDNLHAVLFRLAQSCLWTGRDSPPNPIVPQGPGLPMMNDGTAVESVQQRVTSMYLVYDRFHHKIVATRQGLLLFHKRRDDELQHLYILAISTKCVLDDMYKDLACLRDAMAELCGDY